MPRRLQENLSLAIYEARDKASGSRRLVLTPAGFEYLLVPVLRGGRRVLPRQSLDSIRCRTLAQLAVLPEGARRLDAPERYLVALESGLAARSHCLTDRSQTSLARS